MRNQNQSQVKALNILSPVPYRIVISIAKEDLTYKSPSDTRYEGWRPIWFKCGTEWFGHVLDEKMRNEYCDELLEHIITFPIIGMLTRKVKPINIRLPRLNSKSGTVAYRYYGVGDKAKYRVCVELIKMTVLPPVCPLQQFSDSMMTVENQE